MELRTFGVEEELLVVDLDQGVPSPAGEQLVAASGQLRAGGAADPAMPELEHEFKREQAELGSAPCRDVVELRAQLVLLRREMFDAAQVHGAAVAAIASSPFKVRPTPTPDKRYQAMTAEFGLVARQQLTCGQHVHVQIESPEEGVAVLDRIRPWLAVLTALSANSPFWQGQDSGYQSYRSLAWGLWPTAGPTEPFGDPAGYRRAIAELIASGAAMDDGMIYFDARLSARYPTLEIRVADVCLSVDDAVLIAALSRAMVTTAALDWRSGAPVPPIRTGLLRGAAWRAARSGVSAELVDPVTGTSVPAWRLIDQLVDRLSPVLDRTGDGPGVAAALDRIRADGTGADRQRRAFAVRSELRDVVQDAVRGTQGE